MSVTSGRNSTDGCHPRLQTAVGGFDQSAQEARRAWAGSGNPRQVSRSARPGGGRRGRAGSAGGDRSGQDGERDPCRLQPRAQRGPHGRGRGDLARGHREFVMGEAQCSLADHLGGLGVSRVATGHLGDHFRPPSLADEPHLEPRLVTLFDTGARARRAQAFDGSPCRGDLCQREEQPGAGYHAGGSQEAVARPVVGVGEIGTVAGELPGRFGHHQRIDGRHRYLPPSGVRAAPDTPGHDPYAPAGRRVRVVPGRVGRSPDTGWWEVPMPTIDPLVVAESARQLPRYGPDFAYSHYWAGDSLLAAAGMIAGAGLLFSLAQVPAARRAVERLRPSGSGPSVEQRDKSWFKVRFVGEGGGSKVVTEVAGGDPGYSETAKMIGEAALCLAHDELPRTSGQVTTASAMGPALRSRLQAAGITFTVLP